MNMKQEQEKNNTSKQEEDSEIRFLGQEGGKSEGNRLILGVYSGNLWEHAVGNKGTDSHWYKNKDYHNNSMLMAQFASYGIPIELADLFFEAEFINEKNGLHGLFKFKDIPTKQLVVDCMKAHKKLRGLIRTVTGTYDIYDNQHYVELGRLKDEVVSRTESMGWFIKMMNRKDTVIHYTYTDEETGEQWREELHDGSDYMYYIEEMYRSAGGEQYFDEEE
tara:strand:- start:1504 stop:2163 length:660 start_codon:yes stop_codon:yes gene_type:complete